MPRNSSGTYTLPAGNPVVSGTLIEASWANTTLSDLASAMTNSLSRDGEGGMTAALRLYDGTVSLPGLAFTSETSTGLYRAGSGDMRLAVTGSQVMQFLATGVAVTGTLSASGNATLSGTLAVTGATTLSSTLAVTGAATFSGQTVTLENSTAYYPQLINRNKTNDANGSYISLQKIRSTSVVQNGDVLGNVIFAGYDGAAYLQGAYINAVISATPGTNDMPTDLAFGTTADGGSGPTERMRIDKAGNLGLGVTPSAWATYKALQVDNGAIANYSPTQDASYISNAYYNSGWKYIASAYALRYAQDGSSGSHKWYTAASGTAGNAITFTQAMTLDASGVLSLSSGYPKLRLADPNGGGATFYTQSIVGVWRLVNETSGNENLRVDGSGNLLVGTTATPDSVSVGVGMGGGQIQTTRDSINPNIIMYKKTSYAGEMIRFNYSSTDVGSIDISTTATSYNTSSDYRLKENIAPMTGALDVVTQLKPCTYTWKSTGEDGQGFIAHELQAVVPDAVTGEKDAVDEDGNPKYQGIDTSFLVATLTAAIQELKAEFDAYKATHP